MRHFACVLGIAAVVTISAVQPARVFAADDTWVSVAGTDAGACTIAAPCRNLRYALAQTSPGGTITILSAGRYGPVRITKSVHIMAAGVEAIVTGVASCDAAICIDTGPDDVVSLRGLTIQVTEDRKNGIVFSGGGGLHIDNCSIRGWTFGVVFQPTAPAHLRVFDSKLSAGGVGVWIAARGGRVDALFDRAEFGDGNQALQFQGIGSGSIQGTIRESVITSNWAHGILVAGNPDSTVPVHIMLDRSVLANGQVAIDGGNPLAIVRMGDTVISEFPTLPHDNPTILSYGTNKVVNAHQPSTKIPMK